MSDSMATFHEIENKFDASQNDLVLQASDFSLQGLKEMVDSEVIDLAPRYQRRERWDVERQSQLIESFLLNVPVPPIYLAEEEYGIYSIIDGKQRITAVADYLNNAFALRGLEAFPQIIGLRFRDLPKKLQNALRIRPYFRVITLLRQSHPELKYEVFIRLNRSGIQLNSQEIRNVAFRGPLNDAIYSATENQFLRRALKIDGPKSSAYQQMQDAEYVLRFFALSETWDTFSGSLVKSMDNFMLDNREANKEKIQQLSEKFDQAMSRSEHIWGDAAFQRWDGERWRQQTLAGLFDAQTISVSMLTEAEYLHAVQQSEEIIQKTKNLFSNSEFEEAVRIGTNTPARLRLRVNSIYEILKSNQ